MKSKHRGKLKISKHLLMHEESEEINEIEMLENRKCCYFFPWTLFCKIGVGLSVCMFILIIVFTLVPDTVHGVKDFNVGQHKKDVFMMIKTFEELPNLDKYQLGQNQLFKHFENPLYGGSLMDYVKTPTDKELPNGMRREM